MTNHLEFASDVPGLECPDCAHPTVREVLLVNGCGLVLARHSSCVRCGQGRHRARRGVRVHNGLKLDMNAGRKSHDNDLLWASKVA